MVKLKPCLQAVQSHLAASGLFPGGVAIGEPKAAPPDCSAAIMTGGSAQIGTTLSGSIEMRTIVIRIYVNMLHEPLEDIEFLIDDKRAEVEADLLGDFTLEVTGVRNILPLEVRSDAGYQEVGGTMYRVMDITVPLQIDDSATYAA